MANYALLNQDNIVIDTLYVSDNVILDENGVENDEIGITACKLGLNVPEAKLIRLLSDDPKTKFAGIGYAYDETLKGFLPPKLYNSWILDEDHFIWKPPIEKPIDVSTTKDYVWNEEIQNWDPIEIPALPEPEPPAPLITSNGFRDKLTLSEKLLWDNPETAETISQKAVIVTFKEELPLSVGEEKTTELLNLLISEGIFTSERLDEIISTEE